MHSLGRRYGRLLALYLLGCGGSDASPIVSGTNEAASCKPNTESRCFCPDGKESGKQKCGLRGELEPCECVAPTPSKTQQPSGSGATCRELEDARDCSVKSYESEEVPTSMLFVIDRSRSMVCNLPPLQSSAACEQNPVPADMNQPSKWKITREALAKTFMSLPATGSMVGLSFFANDGNCGVDSTPVVELAALEREQKQELTSALDSVNPDGQTPIVGATILAYAHLHQEAKAPGNRYVVLLTDGAESCAEDGIDRLLEREVKRARDANIRTFVIGAPGSEQARAVLSELAFRGGTARSDKCVHNANGPADVGDCHLDMTKSSDFVSALASALGTVSAAAQSCEFPVEAQSDPNNVNVQYTPSSGAAKCFARDDSKPCDEGANGWQFAVGADGQRDTSKVVLCGEACDAVRSDPAARIDILVGCKSIMYL